MRIAIVHETTYRYFEPARSILQYLRMTPSGHDGQHNVQWRIEPSAEGRLDAEIDPFGNTMHVFAADEPLRHLTIRAAGIVETSDTSGVIRGTAERIPDAYFLRPSSLTTPDEAIEAFARDHADPAGDTLSTLHRLLLAVNETMSFDETSTRSGTSASESFAIGRGVCQDLTHVFLAASRHLDIPCRYVSGYLHREDGVVEQRAGHAWAEAKVPGLGWVGFDPTHAVCVTEAHVRVAVGLDYGTVAPIRGSRRGGGTEGMSVRLTVDLAQRQGQTQSYT